VAVLYLFVKGRLHIVPATCLVIIFMTGIVLTASRTSWLQIVWIAMAGGYLLRKMDSLDRPRFWYGIFALPLILLVWSLLLPHVLDLFHLGLTHTAVGRLESEGVDHNRWLIYSQAWETFKAHPILGIGPGELPFQQFLLMDHYNAVLFATSAHNLILDLLMTVGIVGTAGFVWFGIGWYLRIRGTLSSLETIAMLLILAALGIHSLFEFPEWYGFFLFPAAFLIGAMDPRLLQLRTNTFSRIAPLVGVLYGMGFAVTLYHQYLQLEAISLNYWQKNLQAAPVSTEVLGRLYEYRSKTFFKDAANFVLVWNLTLNADRLDEKLAWSEDAIRYKATGNGLYRHIVWLSLAGKSDEAKFYLVRLKNSFPAEFDLIAQKFVDLGKDKPETYGPIAQEARRLLNVPDR
jgi:hypothetical protein